MSKIGFDCGYGDVKFVFNSEGLLIEKKYPSAISFASIRGGGLGEFSGDNEYDYNGQKYLLGEDAKSVSFVSRSFDFILDNLPLFAYKAMKDVERTTGELPSELCMGLPVDHNDESNKMQVINKLKNFTIN